MNYGKRLQLQPGDKLKFVDIERLYGYLQNSIPIPQIYIHLPVTVHLESAWLKVQVLLIME